MQFSTNDTALVVIDPQNEVLSEKGLSWPLVGASVKENNTVENFARLLQAAGDHGYGVFISPHFLYPYDQAWQFGGAVEKMMLEGKEFWRPGPLSVTGFKPFIENGKTVVVSPHKVFSPKSNDLVLQLEQGRSVYPYGRRGSSFSATHRPAPHSCRAGRTSASTCRSGCWFGRTRRARSG
jgi:nicotinamidase-related amidase